MNAEGPSKLWVPDNGIVNFTPNYSIWAPENGMYAHFLNLNQGESTLVHNKNISILIDAGNSSDGIKVLSYLKTLGIDQIDLLIVSSLHEGHVGGVECLVREINVTTIMGTESFFGSSKYREIVNSSINKNIGIVTARQGEVITFDGNISMLVLSPRENITGELNDKPIALKITFGNISMLLAGDISLEDEYKLLNQTEYDLKSHLLKLPQYGSKNSSSEEFLINVLPYVNPTMIITGCFNDTGHPDQAVLEMIKKLYTYPYMTCEKGYIVFITDGINHITVTPQYYFIIEETPKPTSSQEYSLLIIPLVLLAAAGLFLMKNKNK